MKDQILSGNCQQKHICSINQSIIISNINEQNAYIIRTRLHIFHLWGFSRSIIPVQRTFNFMICLTYIIGALNLEQQRSFLGRICRRVSFDWHDLKLTAF